MCPYDRYKRNIEGNETMSQSNIAVICDPDLYEAFQTLQKEFGQYRGQELVQKIHDSGLFSPDEMVCTTSFGADAAVMLKIISDVNNDIPIAFLDTRKHFQETIMYKDYLRAELELNIHEFTPNETSIAKLEDGKTPELYAQWLASSQSNKDDCCETRKHEPLIRALNGKKLWFTGRKEEQKTGTKKDREFQRQDLPLFEIEDGIIKVNPIKDYTASDIDAFYQQSGLLRHPLFKDGYNSIGCEPCTNAGKGRDGRTQKYCGMHKTERTPN